MKRMRWLAMTLLATAGGVALAQEPAPKPQPDRPPQPDKPKPEKPKPDKPRDESKDHAFVSKAVQSNLMEIALGQLTATQSTNLDVKTFGQRMVADHERLNNELKQLAQKKSITIPDKLSDEEQKMIDGWKKLSGDAFDTRFVGTMVSDHEKAVESYKKASNDSQDADIKTFASNSLPKLEEHLKEARELKDKITQEKPKPEPKPAPDRPDRP
jgi:putative membrane protein